MYYLSSLRRGFRLDFPFYSYTILSLSEFTASFLPYTMAINILVTGCAGFIGSNIVEKLLTLGYRVVGLDNLEYGHYKNIRNFVENDKNFTFIQGDIRDYSMLDNLIKERLITHISHQAARGSVSKSIDNPILTNDININGTLNLLWAAHTNKIERFVCAISSSVYGDTPILPKVESMPYNPISPYALTKVAKEIYCRLFYEIYGLPTIGLRYFNVYGKRQDPNGDYAAIIPKWIQKASNNEDLPLNGTGNQTRDFTYIEDVVEANILSLFTSNQEAFGKGFNIAYGQQVSISELGDTIIHETSSQGKIVHSPARKGDIQDSLGDITLAQNILGYQPRTSISSGIGKTILWYKDNSDYFSNLEN